MVLSMTSNICDLFPTLTSFYQLHFQGTIYSLAIKDNDIFTGGQDCKVKRFSDSDMTEQDCWALDEKHGRVKAITFVGDKLAVGTYNNGILYGLFGDEPEQILYVSFTTIQIYPELI